jgi:hypothetical protein
MLNFDTALSGQRIRANVQRCATNKAFLHQLRFSYVLFAASVEAVLEELLDSIGRPLYDLSCSNPVDDVLLKLVDPWRYHSHAAQYTI